MRQTTLAMLLATLALGACAPRPPTYSYTPTTSRIASTEQLRQNTSDEAKQEAEAARQAIASGAKAPITITAAKAAVSEGLRDPESARFRDVRRNTATGAVCGYLNAKNAYGGYVGESPFIYYHSAKYNSPQILTGSQVAATSTIPYVAAFCPSDATTVTTDTAPPARRGRRS